MRLTAKKKKFSAEASENRRILIGGFGFMHALSIGCMVFFIVRFGMKNVYFWLMALILIGPLVYVDYFLYKNLLIYRSFLKYQFKEDGIHCSGLGVRQFVIPWNTIRTYGLGGVFKEITDLYGRPLTDKHGFSLFFFSQEPYETFNEIPYNRKSQMILEYRKDAWQAATEYMPDDMKNNLENCIRDRRDGLFRR